LHIGVSGVLVHALYLGGVFMAHPRLSTPAGFLRITGFRRDRKAPATSCAMSPAAASRPNAKRLAAGNADQTMFAGLRELVAHLPADQAAVEIVFVNVNPQSTLLLGQARGAAITALVAGGCRVAEYTALQVKQAVVGNGKAAKEQVQHMVRRLLSLPGDPSPDAADALACAIATRTAGRVGRTGDGKGLRVRNGRLMDEQPGENQGRNQ
jgi:crossover junction endodeoxyribonuclease RuvC